RSAETAAALRGARAAVVVRRAAHRRRMSAGHGAGFGLDAEVGARDAGRSILIARLTAVAARAPTAAELLDAVVAAHRSAAGAAAAARSPRVGQRLSAGVLQQ